MRQLFRKLMIISVILTGLFGQSVDVYFDNLDTDANTVDIRYNSTVEVGGAQFDFVGGTLDDYSGGEPANVGWTVSGSETTWLGFSFSGATLPIGDHILTQITFIPNEDEICLNGVVFSNVAGDELDVNIGDCASLSEVEEDICSPYENQEDCEEMCCMWDEDSNSCSDEDDGPPECASDCIGYGDYPELACMEDICEFLDLNEDSECFDTCDEEAFEFIAYFTEMCSENEEDEGCNDENALNFDPESDGEGICYYDPFDEWIQSTTQSFYVINELIIDGEVLSDDDSLYVIGAFCGENQVQVGSAQWDGEGTTIVVMGPDGVTEGTENYCFEGLETPVFIPADVPTFKVFNAVTGEMLDSQFNSCFDSDGVESDCTWANFGYNEIDVLFAGEIEEIVGCMDDEAINFNLEANTDDGSCLYDPFEWIQSTTQAFYVIQNLTVNGIELTADDSLFVIGAFCGDSVQVGSAQWTGEGTTVVVMGPDGVTEGTENYCFEGLETPVFIPADVPYYKVWDAENDEFLNASFEGCMDSDGYESDCAWANFGYNSIQNISAGEEPIEGCTDMDACNYDDQASIVCNGDNSCCEYADEHYDCDGNCENDSDGDEVCDELEIVGCMDMDACNYDDQATDEGECVFEEDCLGECGGNAEYDDCGICDGDGSSCITFHFSEVGLYTDDDCTGDIVNTFSALCDFEPFFGTEEECGGLYIMLPVCINFWSSEIVNIDNEDECMCGEGGQWDGDMEECTSGETGYNMWIDDEESLIEDDYDGPESISLLYDEFSNPTEVIINHDSTGECHWDYGPSPDEDICDQFGGDYDYYDMECEIYNEDDCNELGGYWEEGGDQILDYSVDMDYLFIIDGDEEIPFMIMDEGEGGTSLVANMPEGSCEFINYPTEEDCSNADLDWNYEDNECEIDDEDDCNELGGEWIEEGCFAMVFENQQSNIFGCTEQGNPFYNPEAVINDGSCNLNNSDLITPDQFYLSENYPNPFNPTTQFSYTIPEYTDVELSIYDIQGNLVQSIYNGNHKPGKFKVTIDGSKFASGFYVTVLNAGDVVLSQKMILLK